MDVNLTASVSEQAYRSAAVSFERQGNTDSANELYDRAYASVSKSSLQWAYSMGTTAAFAAKYESVERQKVGMKPPSFPSANERAAEGYEIGFSFNW